MSLRLSVSPGCTCAVAAPSALVALLACGVALWASLRYHWWLGAGNAADELPMIL
jgi:hypothetical protein